MSKPRVLYISGWTRSGSTLVGNVLGELPEVLHVGEMHYLWRNGLLGVGTNSQCGCGCSVRACSLWTQVLSDGVVGADPRAITALQEATVRTRHTARRILENRTGTTSSAAQALGDRLVAAYTRLAKNGGDRLIIDGSKYPAEAAVLLGRHDLDIRVLHIVRDPRATALSYAKAKQYIDPMRPFTSSRYWSAFNLASEMLGQRYPHRYLRIRHEDICANPRDEITRIMRFAGLQDDSPVDANNQVTLGVNHTVTGNPDRLARGTVFIRQDQRWVTDLDLSARAGATIPAIPLMARYGYKVA